MRWQLVDPKWVCHSLESWCASPWRIVPQCFQTSSWELKQFQGIIFLLEVMKIILMHLSCHRQLKFALIALNLYSRAWMNINWMQFSDQNLKCSIFHQAISQYKDLFPILQNPKCTKINHPYLLQNLLLSYITQKKNIHFDAPSMREPISRHSPQDFLLMTDPLLSDVFATFEPVRHAPSLKLMAEQLASATHPIQHSW